MQEGLLGCWSSSAPRSQWWPHRCQRSVNRALQLKMEDTGDPAKDRTESEKAEEAVLRPEGDRGRGVLSVTGGPELDGDSVSVRTEEVGVSKKLLWCHAPSGHLPPHGVCQQTGAGVQAGAQAGVPVWAWPRKESSHRGGGRDALRPRVRGRRWAVEQPADPSPGAEAPAGPVPSQAPAPSRSVGRGGARAQDQHTLDPRGLTSTPRPGLPSVRRPRPSEGLFPPKPALSPEMGQIRGSGGR